MLRVLYIVHNLRYYLITHHACTSTYTFTYYMLDRQGELEANRAGRARAAIQPAWFNYFGFQNWRSGSGWPGA